MSKEKKEGQEGVDNGIKFIADIEEVISNYSDKLSIAEVIAGLRLVEHNTVNNTLASLQGKEE